MKILVISLILIFHCFYVKAAYYFIFSCGSSPVYFPINGQTYNASGTYLWVNTIGDTCFVIVQFVPVSSTSTQSVTTCNSYTWAVNNQTYTTSGSYADTSALDCSVHILDLIIGPAPAIQISSSNNSVCSGDFITLNASGGSSYTWQPGSLTGSSITVNPNSTTLYTVVGSNSSGCTNSATYQVTVIPTVTLSPETVTTCSGYYTWFGNTYTNSGTYTHLTANTSASGCYELHTLILTVKFNPTNGGTIGYDETGCGQSFDPANIVNLSPPTGGYGGPIEYEWYSGSPVFPSLIPGATNPTYDPGVIMQTTMYVRFARTSGCTNSTYLSAQSNWITKTFSYVTSPLSVFASSTTLCAGEYTTLTATGASTYNWMPGNLVGGVVSVNPSSTTTYTVTGTTSAGCIFTSIITIGVNTLPNVGTTTSSTSICLGSSVSLTGTGASSYSWMPGSLTGPTVTLSPTVTTTYTVTGTAINGCTKTAIRTITVSSPSVGTTATLSIICAGSFTTITASGASTYTWQPGALSGTSITVSPSATTTYTVTGTTTNGCTKTATKLITVNPLPTVGTTATQTTICSGSSVTLTGTGANTYSWQPGGLSGVSVIVSPASTTTYTITGTSTNGCAKSATRTITVNNNTSTTSTISSCSPYTWVCNGITQSLSTSGLYSCTSLNASGCVNTDYLNLTVGSNTTSSQTISTCATSYTWSCNGVTYYASGSYTCYTSNTSGCQQTNILNLTINPTPVITISASSANICSGTSALLTASGANTYIWQPGNQTGSSVTVNPTSTTTYTVTGSYVAGCFSTKTQTIIVNNCATTLNLKLFIEGYYIGAGIMSPVLFNQGVIPNANITDTVRVQLRNAVFPYEVISSMKTTLNTDGTATCVFTPFISGTFYIAVLHRNAVQTWSNSTVTVGAIPVTYDFSNAISKAYGNNMNLVSTNPTIYAFYSGDLNQDENIDAIDNAALEFDLLNFAYGYFSTDLNGDGNVDNLDLPIMENNLNNFIFSTHP